MQRIKAVDSLQASVTATQLKAGDRVQLSNIRPAYLDGAFATVVRRKSGRGKPVFYVKVDGDEHESGIPAACLTKVDA